MKLIFRSRSNEIIKTIRFSKYESYQNLTKDLCRNEKPFSASLITSNERINSIELANLKLSLKQQNINFIQIFSFSRDTVLSGKSLKINSVLLNEKNQAKELLQNFSCKLDLHHKGTVRSGNRISSNGDLFIIGDVNPGAIVSAKNNIYVWGKLLGIAMAGEDGNKKALITSLYLNPLQLRICDVVAIGPEEKPKYQYPEIAVLENQKIVIKPYLQKNIR